jgi:hypothetical protein
MTALALSDDDSKAIGRINGALRGPATEIFQQLIPDLRAHTRRDAYERIMNNPHLAATCFREFRARRDLFQPLLVGPDATPVSNDDEVLSCGRTLAQVVALVVRAIAKRYFRARLGIVRRQTIPQKTKPPGLFTVVFGVYKPPPPPPPVRKEYTRADALYQALRAFLLFEWQVSLIPHYAALPISLVDELGARILDYRKVEQIEALARTNKVPGTEPVMPRGEPMDVPVPTSLPTGDYAAPSSGGASVKIELLRAISRRYALASLFGVNETAMNHLIDVISGPGRPVLAALAQAAVAPPEAFVAAASIARRLGLTRFESLMSSQHSAIMLRDLTKRVREQNIKTLKSASEIQQAINQLLDSMLKR